MVVEEYPRDLMELEANFATEDSCRAYLARLRWPTGFRCPRCESEKAWPVRGLWECAACGCQTSVTAGTIFQDTRIPLPVWFRAMWWVTTQKNGASALGLQRVLGLKKYKAAWMMLHKLRRAMVRPGRDLLTGRVEVDECYVGGLEEGLPGRLNSEPTRERSVISTSITIWMSSRFGLIGGDQKVEASSSFASRSRQWPSIPSLIIGSSTRPPGKLKANHNL